MPNTSNRLDHSAGIRGCNATLGACSIRNHKRSITPCQNAPQRASTPVTMLIPAAMNAAPVKYAQNKPPGIQAGTRLAMARGMSKCVMPKTTEQIAKR